MSRLPARVNRERVLHLSGGFAPALGDAKDGVGCSATPGEKRIARGAAKPGRGRDIRATATDYRRRLAQ